MQRTRFAAAIISQTISDLTGRIAETPERPTKSTDHDIVFFAAARSFLYICQLFTRFCQTIYAVGAIDEMGSRNACAIQTASTVFFCPKD